jgi:hypothetical protein
MRTIDMSIPMVPTTRTFDPRNPVDAAQPTAPSVETQHEAQRRGITMEQALAQQEHFNRREDAKHTTHVHETEARDFLRSRKGHQAMV